MTVQFARIGVRLPRKRLGYRLSRDVTVFDVESGKLLPARKVSIVAETGDVVTVHIELQDVDVFLEPEVASA